MMEMVLEICMAAAVVLVTRYLVPWLRGRLEAEGQASLTEKVEQYVEAAEQLIQGAARGAERLDYVEELLEADGVAVTGQVRAMIESAVYRKKA